MATDNCNRVVLYARVSTINHNQDPEVQLRELRQYVAARGWQVAGEYVDHGVSGTKESRPQLNRLMNDARKRRFDGVIVWKFDRFARSTKHLLTALEEFRALGVSFTSYSENIDTTTPMGQAMFTIIGAVATLERDLIAERVRAGLRHAQAKGVRLGRPRTAVNIEQARKLRGDGLSWKQVGAALGVDPAIVFRAARA